MDLYIAKVHFEAIDPTLARTWLLFGLVMCSRDMF
jgi:hypothetical protein